MMCVKYTMFKNFQDNCTFLTNCCTNVNMSNIQVSCMIQMSQLQSRLVLYLNLLGYYWIRLREVLNW